jgi:hypothetical protein
MGTKQRAGLIVSGVVVAMLLVAVPAYAAGDAYEPDNSLKTAKVIKITPDVADTGVQNHNFHSKADADYVKLGVKKGASYVVKVIGTNDKSQSHWMKVTIYRYSKTAGKWYVAKPEAVTTGGLHHLTFKAVATTTYAVRVRAYNGGGIGAKYGIRVISGAYPFAKDAYYAGTDASHPTTLTAKPFNYTAFLHNFLYTYGLFGADQLHSIDTSATSWASNNWYKVHLTPSQATTYYVEVFTGDWAPHTMRLTLYNSGITQLGNVVTQTGNYVRYYIAPITYEGDFYIKLSNDTPARYWYRVGLYYKH